MSSRRLPIAMAGSALCLAVAWLGCVSLKVDAFPPMEDAGSSIGGGDARPDELLPDQNAEFTESAAEDDGAVDVTSADEFPAQGSSPYAESGTTADLPSVAPGHLHLWLTADRGLACSSGRVTAWQDQSGNVASAHLAFGQIGPRCNVPGHGLGPVNLPYFSDPANGNIIDETLDVDLSFLQGADYTIFVVERRWSDLKSNYTRYAHFVLGTDAPDQSPQGLSCGLAVPQNHALQLGYVYYHGSSPGLVLDQTCNTLYAQAAAVPVPPPAPVSRDVFQFDAAAGHFIFVDGVAVAQDADTSALTTAFGGAVGRAFAYDTTTGLDGRFSGDIAEIIAFDVSLSDSARTQIDAYLKAHWGL